MPINMSVEYPKLETENAKLRQQANKLKEDNEKLKIDLAFSEEMKKEAHLRIDKLAGDNLILLDALKGLPKLLNDAANSLEAQAKRENMLNTLVEPLRKFANAIQQLI